MLRTIGQVSELLGKNDHQIRYAVARLGLRLVNLGGRHAYTSTDVAALRRWFRSREGSQ